MFGKRKGDEQVAEFESPTVDGEVSPPPIEEDSDFIAACLELGMSAPADAPQHADEPSMPAREERAPEAALVDALDIAEPDTAQSDLAAMAAQLEQSEARVAALTVEAELLRAASAGPATAGEIAEHSEALEESEARVAELTAEVERLRAASVRGDPPEVVVEDPDARVTALSSELDRLRADSADTADASSAALATAHEQLTELQATVEHLRVALRETNARADEIATEHVRLSNELAASLQTQSSGAAEVASLKGAVEEQRVWYEEKLARLRDSEARQSASVKELGSALAAREAEVEALQSQLLEVETRRAEEAASLLAMFDK